MAKRCDWISSLLVVGMGALLASCSQGGSSSSSSQVKITFPSAAELKQKNSSAKVAELVSAFDFTKSCFAVNVTAADLNVSGTPRCSITKGVFTGFANPGDTVTLNIPRGTGRKMEILVFQRNSSSDSCPSGRSGTDGMDVSKLARVGQIASFDTTTAEVTLDITVAAPAAGTNLQTQYSLPGNCIQTATPNGFGSARVVAGHATQTGGTYKVNATVSGLRNELQLQGGAYRVRLSRQAQ